MISLFDLFVILIVHWFADFVLQTDWQAKNKSKNFKALTLHVSAYSVVWFIVSMLYIQQGGNLNFYWLAPITFVCHFITDYFTSRLNSKLLAKDDIHNFFVSVGFDQVLHYTQLILTIYFIGK